MIWLLLGLTLLVLYVALRGRARTRHARLTAVILIPANGATSVSFEPESADPDDLSLMTLCFATKMRWLLNSEPHEVTEALIGFIDEAARSWDESGPDLISRMPTASKLRVDNETPQAIPSGEVFRVIFHRTNFETLQNRASVITQIPRPGMVVNLAWSVVLLLNEVESRLDAGMRRRLVEALGQWLKLASGPLAKDQSQRGLRQLNDAVFRTWAV